jgi:hypothetical protein
VLAGATTRGIGTQLAAQPVQQVAGGVGSGLAGQGGQGLVKELGGGVEEATVSCKFSWVVWQAV